MSRRFLNPGYARGLGLTPTKGGNGLPPLPAGYAFRTVGDVPLSLNGTYPIYKVS